MCVFPTKTKRAGRMLQSRLQSYAAFTDLSKSEISSRKQDKFARLCDSPTTEGIVPAKCASHSAWAGCTPHALTSTLYQLFHQMYILLGKEGKKIEALCQMSWELFDFDFLIIIEKVLLGSCPPTQVSLLTVQHERNNKPPALFFLFPSPSKCI